MASVTLTRSLRQDVRCWRHFLLRMCLEKRGWKRTKKTYSPMDDDDERKERHSQQFRQLNVFVRETKTNEDRRRIEKEEEESTAEEDRLSYLYLELSVLFCVAFFFFLLYPSIVCVSLFMLVCLSIRFSPEIIVLVSWT